MRTFVAIALLFVLSACQAVPNFEQPSLGGPKLDLEDYFDRPVSAYGQFQDVLGKVRSRFTVEIDPSWDGEVLILVEDFVYDDGREQQRIWELTKTGEDTWEGRANDVDGVALGVEDADRFNFTYSVDLETADGAIKVEFDDWLWRFDDKRVLNKAYVSRFGVRIGVVTIFFEKD